jgi:hypothetical protein
VVQNLLISSTAGITPTSGSTVLLAALSPLLTLAGRCVHRQASLPRPRHTHRAAHARGTSSFVCT